jgi:mono/diheme cytochrome c family protein
MQIGKSLCLVLVSMLGVACQTDGPNDTKFNSGTRADAGVDASEPGGEDLVDASQPTDAPVAFERVLEIFGEHCVPCHATTPERPNGMGKLDLGTAKAAYDQLVGVAAQGGACLSGGQQRVVPGDADASLLMDKLINSSGMCGAPMPKPAMGQAFVPIPEAQIAEIARWIEDGAPID